MIGGNILVYKTEKFNVVQYFNSFGFVEAIGYQKLVLRSSVPCAWVSGILVKLSYTKHTDKS